MFTCFQHENANGVWIDAFESILQAPIVDSRAGVTREVLHSALCINDPTQKWVSRKSPPISISYALAELIYVLKGSDDARVINYWNNRLSYYAGNYLNYPGAYGPRIITRYGINQLEKVYETLYYYPESRQAVLLIWDPKTDLPNEKGIPNNKDIPCNVCSMLKVRNNKLEWTQIMRSNDIVLGFPYDIVLFTSIQEILASWLGIEVGSYNHLSDSLHIYVGESEKIKLNKCDVKNTDSLQILKKDYLVVVDKIYNVMKRIAYDSNYTREYLKELSDTNTGYEAYNNIIKLLCAYAANKQNESEVRDSIISECTNIAYRTMWQKWIEYYSGGYKDE